MPDPSPARWAAIIPEPDGSVAVYVHGWILAGKAKNADEFWKLVHEAWYTPEKFWELFYAALGHAKALGRERPAVDPKLEGLSIEDLGL